MPVTPGYPYGAGTEILSSIGAGGMGEVYRARDATPRSRGRHQGAAGVVRGRRGPPPPLRAGGPRGRRAQSSEHPRGLRHRQPRRRRPTSSRSCSRARRCARRIGTAPLPRRKAIDYAVQIASGPRRRARQGHRPPRPQARERVRHARRAGEDPRLRPRQAGPTGAGLETETTAARRGAAADERGHRDGDRRLHVARAGARRRGRSPVRHLLVRRRALRDAHRRARLPRRLGRRDDERDPQGRSGAIGPTQRCRRRSIASCCTASRRTPRSASSPPATWRSLSRRCRAIPALSRAVGRLSRAKGRTASWRPPPALFLAGGGSFCSSRNA